MNVACQKNSYPVLALRGVSLNVGKRRLLEDITLKFNSGEFVAILGPNGVGKTTLLRAMAGLSGAEGEIEISGTPIGRLSSRARASQIAYLPQGGEIFWPMSVKDVVALGRLPFETRFGKVSENEGNLIAKVMQDCDLTSLALRAVTDLSGGERARVLLARMLAVNAPLMLVDEPVAALDPAHQIHAMRLLAKASMQGQTVIAVLHDVGLAMRYATRVIGLFEGRVIGDDKPGAFMRSGILDRLYGLRYEMAALPSGILTPFAGI